MVPPSWLHEGGLAWADEFDGQQPGDAGGAGYGFDLAGRVWQGERYDDKSGDSND